MKAEVDTESGGGSKNGSSHLCLIVASASQVSRLTWFTRHDPVPLATPLPPTLPQNGTTEATSTSIQLETVQENKSKAHSRELPLVLVVVEFKKHYSFGGD